MPRPETASPQQPFDLGRYNPHTAFVEPLKQAINQQGGEAPVEWSVQSKPVAVDTTYKMLCGLHPDALAPAIDQVLFDLDSKKGIITPQEEAVYDFLDGITQIDLDDPDLPQNEETRLAKRYHESENNAAWYYSFLRRKKDAGRFSTLQTQLTDNWQTLQAREATEVPDDQTIADNWNTLRTLLSEEREWEDHPYRHVQVITANMYPGLYQDSSSVDPRLHGVAQNQEEDRIKASMPKDQTREARVQALVETVHSLRAIPAQESARILMEQVLTEDERKKIVKLQQHYRQAEKDFLQFAGYTSYKDLAQNPIKGNDLFYGGNGLIDILDVVIKDYISIPCCMIHELHKPQGDSEEPFGARTAFEQSRDDLLKSYVADVATALLLDPTYREPRSQE